MGLVLAHLSDLHVSRFGEHVTSLRSRRLHGRAARAGEAWTPVEQIEGWGIERLKRELRLIDEDGRVHARKKAEPADEAGVRAGFTALARERMSTEHSRLAAALPDAAALDGLLARDPSNTNLLFCRAAQKVLADAPDWIVLTGDVTDDGVGYDLVLAALAPYVARRRLLAIPGNHDIYDSPLMLVPGHARKRLSEKRALWEAFAVALGLPAAGPWVRELAPGALMCGLDSCVPARTPLSASGAVSPADLALLEAELGSAPASACRLAMLHHHVVNPPFRAVGLSPWQLGLRLRNARVVYDFFCRLGFRGVLNGHRHVGYRYHPAHAPLFISAPSSTLGCRSGSAPAPFYWRIELDGGEIASVRERLL